MTDHDSDSGTTRDEWLAVRCQLGEREAFDELVDTWHGPLWRYARRMTGSDDAAGETMQDVWLRVLRGVGRLREPASLRAWLFGIARRVLMDRLRMQYAEPATVDAGDAQLAAPDEGDDIEGQLDLMRGAMERLPATEREVLTLFYLCELSLVDVASVLGVPVGTVKSRLFRARQMLRVVFTSLMNGESHDR
jgi:RNA polymerase sigma factor (sigma-70 family)